MIIYSCITNGYDDIPDHYYDPDVRYVMFHDGTVAKKGPWEFIDVRDYCNLKLPRDLALYPKINPHKFFAEGEDVVWIDGCYLQTKEFVEQSKKMFPLSILRHEFKFSYYDEMLEGFMASFFTYDDAVYVTKYLSDIGYNFKKYMSPCCAIIWRTISTEISRHGDLWWELVMAEKKDYVPVRDQIAFDAAFQLLNITPNIIEDRSMGNNIICGVNLHFNNKYGRRKKHLQRGSIEQWKSKNSLLEAMRKYAKMHPQLYVKHNHSFIMYYHDIISEQQHETFKINDMV